MYEPYKYKNSKLLLIKILEAAYVLLLLVLLLLRRKKKKINAFSWAKNTARGVRFLLGFINRYLFWLNVNRYTCFRHLPKIKSYDAIQNEAISSQIKIQLLWGTQTEALYAQGEE